MGNPKGLDDVHTCVLEDPLWRPHPALADLIASLQPALLFGFGFIPAWLMEEAAPDLPVVFMTAGCRQVQSLIESGAVKDFISFRRRVAAGLRYPVQADNRELQACERCELLLVHSPLVKFAFEHLFPEYTGKIYSNIMSVADLIYAEAGRFAALQRDFEARDIDALFIASNWSRPEKNFPLARKIISRCRGLNLHVVGDVDRSRSGAKYHGPIADREEIYRLLGRAKTVVSPSLIDAAPGILFEASAMGCNVVTSRNCGNWRLCHEQLLVQRYAASEFAAKIRLSTSRPYKDNRELFLGGYEDLVETLGVLWP
jgi:glycosyltransferase involved in cell wall biosynthesis